LALIITLCPILSGRDQQRTLLGVLRVTTGPRGLGQGLAMLDPWQRSGQLYRPLRLRQDEVSTGGAPAHQPAAAHWPMVWLRDRGGSTWCHAELHDHRLKPMSSPWMVRVCPRTSH